MKCIGIVLMIVGHTISISKPFIYVFHMPLFFILSGYLYRDKKSSELCRSLVKSLLKPYFVTCFFVILFQVILSVFRSESPLLALKQWGGASIIGLPSNKITAENVKGVTAIGAIWFLEALFWAKV